MTVTQFGESVAAHVTFDDPVFETDPDHAPECPPATRDSATPEPDGAQPVGAASKPGLPTSSLTHPVTARQMLRRPPVRTLPCRDGRSSTLFRMSAFRSATGRSCSDSTRAAAPATIGAAVDVPSMNPYVPPGSVE